MYTHPRREKHGTRFRVDQVDVRERELFAMKQFVLQSESLPQALRDLIDTDQVFVAGFSYGATTSSLSVARHPNDYRGALLLDGWFSVDLSSFAGWGNERFDFPPEAFERPDGLSPVPCCFIGSEQFSRWPHMADATRRLARSAGAPVDGASEARKSLSEWHILPASKHQNFVDVGFWVPARLLRRLGMLGACDYHDNYRQLLDLQAAFLRKLVKPQSVEHAKSN
jgi:pimeloyl-ACP methyl ester carboxylesterase